jgi:predicted metal-dependent phosphotriesterase family hydrolase
MPSKKHLALLEEHGIISKKLGGNVFKDIGKATEKAVKATGKATKTAVKATGKATKTAVKYVGEHEKDIRKVIKNPIVKAGIMGVTSVLAPELDPLVAVALSAAGKAKKQPSEWIKFVMDLAKQNNLKYSDALKQASPHYKKMKGGYAMAY